MESWKSLKEGGYLLLKRGLDLIVAGGMLVGLFPILAIIGGVIWLWDRHPPLYRQLRVGKGGKLFYIYKFRTMVPNAEELLQQVLERDPTLRAQWERSRKLDPDPRVTPIGKLLRRSSLDELPQLWNVVVGEMSLVGPRPYLPEELEGDWEFYTCYIQMRPGLTGLWQVEGRHSLPFQQRKKLDCLYYRNRGLCLDLKILIKTPLVLFEGA
ncbi:MAG: sugar transferase [Campylobacterales bacterium]